MSLSRVEMGCIVHIIGILCTIPSGSADLKTALVCSIAEGAKAIYGMGRLTLQQTVRFVVILHLLPVFPLAHPPVTGYISGSVDIFACGAKGEVFSDVPAVCGSPTGTESEQTEIAKG